MILQKKSHSNAHRQKRTYKYSQPLIPNDAEKKLLMKFDNLENYKDSFIFEDNLAKHGVTYEVINGIIGKLIHEKTGNVVTFSIYPGIKSSVKQYNLNKLLGLLRQ